MKLFHKESKQKTAYEIIAGDWSSDVCSSDLAEKTLRFRPFFCRSVCNLFCW